MATIATIVTRFVASGVSRVVAAVTALRAAINHPGMNAGMTRPTRQLAAMARTGIAAGRAITKSMQGAAKAVGSVATAAKKIVFNKFTAIGGAAYGAGALGLKALGPLGTLAGGLGAVGLAGIAGAATMEQVRNVRRLMRSARVGPELASSWGNWASEVGLTTDNIDDLMGTLGSKALEATLDRTGAAAQLFKAVGVRTHDATGQMRNFSDMAFDLAKTLGRLNDTQKVFVLDSFFGEGKGADLLPLFDKLKDREKLVTEMQADQRDGLLVNQGQIEAYESFTKALSGALKVLQAFARELFTTFVPIFNQFLDAFVANFRDPKKREKAIREWFIEPFWKAFALVRDILKVFAGIDFVTAIFGGETDMRVQNTWLLDLKWWLLSIWNTVVGLVSIFQGFGRALLDIAGYVDRIVQGFTGFSLSDWLNDAASTDFRAFGRDVRQVLGDLFEKPIDPTALETSFGRALGGFLEFLQRTVGPAVADLFGTTIKGSISLAAAAIGELKKAMDDINAAMASGKGMAGLQTTLGRLLWMLGQAAQWVADLATNLQRVFLLGEGAGPGFQWLDDLRKWLVENDVAGKLSAIVQALPGILSQIGSALKAMGPYLAMAGRFVGDDIAGKHDAGKEMPGALAGVGKWLFKQVAGIGPNPGFAEDQLGRPIDPNAPVDPSAAQRAQANAFVQDLLDAERRRSAEAAEAAKSKAALAALAPVPPPEPPVDKTPVLIQVQGVPQPLRATMAPSELDAARAMSLRRAG